MVSKQRPLRILLKTNNIPPKNSFLPQLGQNAFSELYPTGVNNMIIISELRQPQLRNLRGTVQAVGYGLHLNLAISKIRQP
jgi:hypothetical protein